MLSGPQRQHTPAPQGQRETRGLQAVVLFLPQMCLVSERRVAPTLCTAVAVTAEDVTVCQMAWASMQTDELRAGHVPIANAAAITRALVSTDAIGARAARTRHEDGLNEREPEHESR